MTETSSAVDDLFGKIDQISDKIKQDETKQSTKKKSGSNSNFKNVDTVFLHSISGNYEFRLLSDSEGEFVEEILLHSIALPTGKKATVICTSRTEEGCDLCDKRKKLDELQIKNGVAKDKRIAWKYDKYKLNKILIKTGEVPAETLGLKSETVYICYVDDKFWSSLVNAIQTNRKYFAEDIKKMMNHAEASSGFMVSANKVKKSMVHNFNFIQQMKIEGFQPKDVFGTATFKIVNQGMFRNNFISKTKLDAAKSQMNSLLMKNSEASKEGAGDTAPTPNKNEGQEVKKTDEPTPAPQENVSTGTSQEVEVKVETTSVVEQAATPAAETKIETVAVVENTDGEIVIDPAKINATTGKPECFGKFDPSNNTCLTVCKDVQRDCIMSAY